MALARLITRTPEYAQRLAHSLQSAGYSVEFAFPEDHFTEPAELEVNLDDPSAAASYLVTADGTEISFAYDAAEREFVLAPLWRKVTALFASLRRKASVEEPAQEAPLPQIVPPAPVQPAVAMAPQQFEEVHAIPDDVTATRVMPIEFAEPIAETELETIQPPVMSAPLESFAMQSLYLPDSAIISGQPETDAVEFSGADLFDGQGTRKHSGRTVAAPPIGVEESQEQAVSQLAPELPRASWLVAAALQAESLGKSISTAWNQRRIDIAARMSHLGAHDASWLRAMPIAAIITLAFLLGWGFSGTQRVRSATKAPSVTPVAASATQASVLPAPVAAPKRVAAKPIVAKLSRTHRPARDWDSDDEEDVAQDVIVRHYPKHYPSKGVSATNQKTAVKRFSDIE